MHTDIELKEAKAAQRFVGIMLALILALLLSACGSTQGWHVAHPGYSATASVRHIGTEAELHAVCGVPRLQGAVLEGCAVRMPALCVIFLGPRADACTLRHEQRHCRGWDHPADQRIDCLLD